MSVLCFDGAEALPVNEREYSEGTVQRYEAVSNTKIVEAGDTSSDTARKGRFAASLVNLIAKVYQIGTPVVGVAALILFSVLLIFSIRRKKTDHLPYLLVTSGMGLSVMVMLIGIVYTDITAFPAIRHTYLAGAYPLNLACIFITILYRVDQRS